MSVLAVDSLFSLRAYDYSVIPPPLACLTQDIFFLFIRHLCVEKFEMLALQGCHKWSIWMRDFAREVVRTRWPELFMEFDHPKRNWVALYCAKMQVDQNMLEGRCELYRLELSVLGEPHYTLGMEFGKFCFPSARSGNDWDMEQLRRLLWKINGKIKCRGVRSHTVYYENSQEGWRTSVVKYQNRTLILRYSDENLSKGQPYLFDPHSRKLQRVLPPVKEEGFVRVVPITYIDLEYFPSNTLGLMWMIERNGIAEQQLFASYQMNAGADELHPISSISFPLDFPPPQYKIQSAYSHEGYVIILMKGMAIDDKYRWCVFESSPTLLQRRENVGHVLSVPGKIFLFGSEPRGKIAVEVLDTHTKESRELILPLHSLWGVMDRLPAWIYPINESKILVLGLDFGSKKELRGYLIDIKSCALTEILLPKMQMTTDALTHVSFDGEKLLFKWDALKYSVLNFGSRHPNKEIMTKKVEGMSNEVLTPFDVQTVHPVEHRWSLSAMPRWGLYAIGIILVGGALYYSRNRF